MNKKSYKCICGETSWEHSQLEDKKVCRKCRRDKDKKFSCNGCEYLFREMVDEEFTGNTFCNNKLNKNVYAGNNNLNDCPLVKDNIEKYSLMKELFKHLEERSLNAEIGINKNLQNNIDYKRLLYEGQELAYQEIKQWIKERIENESNNKI